MRASIWYSQITIPTKAIIVFCEARASLGGNPATKSTNQTRNQPTNPQTIPPNLPSGKLTWQRKMDQLKMYSLFKMGMFHCHVSLLEANDFSNLATCPMPWQEPAVPTIIASESRKMSVIHHVCTTVLMRESKYPFNLDIILVHACIDCIVVYVWMVAGCVKSWHGLTSLQSN